MSETNPNHGDDRLLALRYAAGQLDARDVADFESRLADDQSARDALCAAVRLRLATAGQPALLPDPRYRGRVRRRLRAGAWPKSGAFTSRIPRSLFTLAGAAAAALLLLTLRPVLQPAGDPVSRQPDLAKEMPAPPAGGDDQAAGLPDLLGGEHLARAVDEEIRRKNRADDGHILRTEDRAAKGRGAPVYRQ
jgi:hypothetical protein